MKKLFILFCILFIASISIAGPPSINRGAIGTGTAQSSSGQFIWDNNGTLDGEANFTRVNDGTSCYILVDDDTPGSTGFYAVNYTDDTGAFAGFMTEIDAVVDAFFGTFPASYSLSIVGDKSGILDFTGKGVAIASNGSDLDFYTGASAGNLELQISGENVKVKGNLDEEKYYWVDEFDYEAAGVQLESSREADFYVSAGTNYAAANVTILADPGGALQCVTAGGDDDSVTITGVANIRADNNPIIEARIKIADITNAYMAVGLVEGSYADKATHDDDIIVVGFDSDNGHTLGADEIIIISNDNNGGVDYDDTGQTITNGTYVEIRIDCTDTEQPRVWIDDTEVTAASISGTIQAGTSLSAYFMVQSLSGAADTATIDYFKVWQDR